MEDKYYVVPLAVCQRSPADLFRISYLNTGDGVKPNDLAWRSHGEKLGRSRLAFMPRSFLNFFPASLLLVR